MNARTFLPAVLLATLTLGFATSAADATNASRSLARDQVQRNGIQMSAYIRNDRTDLAGTDVGARIPDNRDIQLRDDIVPGSTGFAPDENGDLLSIDQDVAPPTSLLGSALRYFVQISLFHHVGF